MTWKECSISRKIERMYLWKIKTCSLLLGVSRPWTIFRRLKIVWRLDYIYIYIHAVFHVYVYVKTAQTETDVCKWHTVDVTCMHCIITCVKINSNLCENLKCIERDGTVLSSCIQDMLSGHFITFHSVLVFRTYLRSFVLFKSELGGRLSRWINSVIFYFFY